MIHVAALLAVVAHADSFTATLNAGHQLLREQFKAVSFGSEEDALVSGLSDSDPAVRVQALKGLKRYASFSSRAREASLKLLTNDSSAQVRREAARTLSSAVADSNVSGALLRAAEQGNGMAYKALYWQVQFDSRLRDAVLKAARGNNEDAIWALMYAGGDADVRRELLALAQRGSDAAARSLYAQVNFDSDVKRFARDAADRGSCTGSMMLAESPADRDRLQRVGGPCAMTAIQGWTVELVHYFHLNQYTWRNGYAQLVSEAIDRE